MLPCPPACSFCPGTPAQGIPHAITSLFTSSTPLPPWQIFRFIYDTKSKQSGLLSSCWRGFCEKLLGKFLSLGQEKKNEPKNKAQKKKKSFLQQILFCFSVQQERLKSTATSWHVAEGRGANGDFISEWQRFVLAKCSSAGRAVKCCLLGNNSSSD